MTAAQRRLHWKEVLSFLLLLALLLAPTLLWPARGNAPAAFQNPPADVRLSVMTYNVEGLPWPVRFGRATAIERISMRLRQLRAAGRQPHVVVLQEAFSEDAKRIGADAGYTYVVRGPVADLPGDAARTSDEKAFEASASAWKGERIGKLADSGLLILSDYPILSVRRMAFPAYACAGYDCLANKGAVMAMIAVPGQAAPIAVVDTHLNSRAAAGVDRARSLVAFRQQVDALGRFVNAHRVPGSPLIVAGDFNMGKDVQRRAYLRGAAQRWWNGPADVAINDSLHSCADATDGCASTLNIDARHSLRRSKDMQFIAPSLTAMIRPERIAVPFGHESDGTMLSDHIGYVVYYDWRQRAGQAS